MLQAIDTHVHIWDFSKARYDWLEGNNTILHRAYSIDELSEMRVTSGISGAVLVQAANNFEDTDWMLQVAGQTDWILGVVGWLPLTQPGQTERAIKEKYQSNNFFKGVRHLIHDESDPRWLLQEPVIESLKFLAVNSLPFDLVGVLPEHIETALEVSARIPNLQIVFDHLNQPPIKQGEKFGRWGELMKEASSQKNFFAKISGLGTTCGNPVLWTESTLLPYLEVIFENFGIDRCFCGSDWPVSLLASDYSTTWKIYRDALSTLLMEADQEKVLCTNAKKFYGL